MAGETIDETVTTEPVATAPAFGSPGERFVLGEELGRGGMGRVVAARDVALEREVAIKQVLTDDRELIARFEREVRITAQLEHPSIVALHEAGRDSAGLPFYVMRRIAGVALSERLAKADGVRARLALLPSVVAVVDAAAFAHAKRIIHRDIKPANIMLGPYGEAYLIDWGIARHLDDPTESLGGVRPAPGEELTRAGQLYGTVAYMAPEQARGESVDERADVFALGATLFHVLAGRAPFSGLSAAERIARASEGEQVPLDQLPEEVPRDLVAVVTKAMAGEREGRYRDAGELARDLRAFLAGQLVAARHYTAAQRAARFLRKHAIAAVAIAAIAVAAIVFGVVTITGIVDARREADRERISAQANERLARSQEADTLLLLAASVANEDATRGALMVQHLLASEEHGVRARDLVTAAAAMGIARGARLPIRETIRAGAFSPDHRRVVLAGRLGTVYTFELHTGAGRRLVDHRREILEVLWPESSTIIAVDPHGLVAFDAETGVARRLLEGPAGEPWFVAERGAIRYVDRDARELREIALAGGAPRTVARGVERAQGGPADSALLVGAGEVRLLSGGTETVLETGGDVSPGRLALTKDRVAVAFDKVVRLWDTGGHPLHTWSVEDIRGLRFYGRRIIATAPAGVATLIYEAGQGYVLTTNHHQGEQTLLMSSMTAETSSGPVYGYSDGRIFVGDSFGFRKLATPPETLSLLLGSPASPFLVAVYVDGPRWWDTSGTTLGRLPIDALDLATGALCWVSRTWVLAAGWGSANVIDLVANTAQRVKADDFVGPVTCHGAIGDDLYATVRGDRVVRIDLASATVFPTDVPPGLVISDGTILYPRDRQLVERVRGTGPEHVRWTAPAPITSLTAHAGRVLVASGEHLHRLDANGQVTAIASGGTSWSSLDLDGAVYWSTGRTLWTMPVGDLVPRARELSAPVLAGLPQNDEGVVLELADGSLWLASPRTLVARQAGARHAVGTDRLGRVATVRPNRVLIHHLRSGLSLDHFVPAVSSLMFDLDGRLVIRSGPSLAVHRTPTIDATSVAAWLSTATNATLVNGVLRWPTVVDDE